MAVLCYHKFYAPPKKAEAAEQMFPAKANFRSQNYELALNGDGNVLGFSQVIDEYGSYAGDAAFFYAGVCELQLDLCDYDDDPEVFVEEQEDELVSGGFERIPNTELKDVTPEQRETLNKLTDLLENDDDVTNVYNLLKPAEE